MSLSTSTSAVLPFTSGQSKTKKGGKGKAYSTPKAPSSAVTLRATDPALADFPGLFDILSLMRPDDSRAELLMIEQFIVPTGAMPDAFGNYVLKVGDSKVLWSSHTDTVHHQSGRQQLVLHNGVDIYARDSNCLGADCGTGVWLMLQMIKANVPGLYVFHRSEESGGHGSNWIAQHNPKLLERIDYAIAFDRKGESSIITHQWGGRCCSAEFALSFALALDMGHTLDDGGSFTDTANYTDKVSECTNLSVGYERQHSADERQNLPYLRDLLAALLAFDEDALTAKRDPSASSSSWEDDYGSSYLGAGMESPLSSLVYNYPDAVAVLLEELGYDEEGLRAQVTNIRARGRAR